MPRASRSVGAPPSLPRPASGGRSSGEGHRTDRIGAAFARCRAAGEAALVTYVMAGDPDVATSKAMAVACAEGGADLIELGIPFSDPIADGPTIQHAAERALAAGTTTRDVLAVAAHVRARSDVPIALMGYLNPILSHAPSPAPRRGAKEIRGRGVEAFARDCERAGVDALIVPDLLPEEAGEIAPVLAARGVRTVFLLAPTSGPERIAQAARAASGFLYFVSVTGVTGARRSAPAEIGPLVGAVRAQSPVPVVIGFGVSTPEQARALAPLADGVVVGSAIVQRIAEGGPRSARTARVKRFVAGLKKALRA